MNASTFLLLLVFTVFSVQWLTGQVHVINTFGNVYTPSHITIAPGDTVLFQLSVAHDALEVSQQTYQANGVTPLPGGFSVPLGGGQVIFDQPGVHYFVCTPHAHLGMKGTVTVEEATSVNDIQAQNDFSIEPNPAENVISLQYSNQLDGRVNVAIYDLNGRYTGVSFGFEAGEAALFRELDISYLPAGVFFVRVQCPQRVMYKKFVKQ